MFGGAGLGDFLTGPSYAQVSLDARAGGLQSRADRTTPAFAFIQQQYVRQTYYPSPITSPGFKSPEKTPGRDRRDRPIGFGTTQRDIYFEALFKNKEYTVAAEQAAQVRIKPDCYCE